jgi:integrase
MMGKKAIDLAPLAVAKLKTPGLHFVGHVSGLALNVTPTGARSWILRAVVGRKRRDMGLGSFPEVSLASAKTEATEKRKLIRDGIDPIEARRAAQAALKAEQASFINFKDAATQYVAAHEKGWKNAKHAAQWKTTLETYAYPVIGSLRVRDVSLAHIMKIIEPMWNEKAETANRLRGRIEAVLDWARARGFRVGDNPAQWRGNLDTLLPPRNKVSKVKHHAALNWQDCPAFLSELRKHEGIGPRALEFVVLTACRSGEVRGATWAEIDMNGAVWTIPAGRMKAEKEHRVPLSAAALKVLQSAKKEGGGDLVFPNSKGKILSDMTLTMLLRRMKTPCTVHGFRSTFRDWAGETTAFPREVIEHAMAHQLKDRAEAAYARGDLFIKRIALMKTWAEFLSNSPAKGKDITQIGHGARRHV